MYPITCKFLLRLPLYWSIRSNTLSKCLGLNERSTFPPIFFLQFVNTASRQLISITKPRFFEFFMNWQRRNTTAAATFASQIFPTFLPILQKDNVDRWRAFEGASTYTCLFAYSIRKRRESCHKGKADVTTMQLRWKERGSQHWRYAWRGSPSGSAAWSTDRTLCPHPTNPQRYPLVRHAGIRILRYWYLWTGWGSFGENSCRFFDPAGSHIAPLRLPCRTHSGGRIETDEENRIWGEPAIELNLRRPEQPATKIKQFHCCILVRYFRRGTTLHSRTCIRCVNGLRNREVCPYITCARPQQKYTFPHASVNLLFIALSATVCSVLWRLFFYIVCSWLTERTCNKALIARAVVDNVCVIRPMTRTSHTVRWHVSLTLWSTGVDYACISQSIIVTPHITLATSQVEYLANCYDVSHLCHGCTHAYSLCPDDKWSQQPSPVPRIITRQERRYICVKKTCSYVFRGWIPRVSLVGYYIRYAYLIT